MFKSVLIANRGEIARRVIRTCRRLGLRTIAVYSEADADALHVREADAAVLIGPSPAAESYLLAERILTAARQSGADAIHPGYGFLSENAAFAEAVLNAGLVWVGPPPSAIRAMALKDAAKDLMLAAGVPVTPGYQGADQDAHRLRREANLIGYPVLIKAIAGGGGKGMRRVEQEADFDAALASCRREASASFGDDRVLIEKYISRPRHIEVQVFADRRGQTVHLFERDCSVQRRHQKVIEEAPAPGMTPEVRAFICDAAVRAARAVNYEGAGTVEFIADGSDGLRSDRISFMEMNTRLQVEHPVTEAVTGLDLVEWQLRVAAGEPLPLAQDQITLTGHAIEARLYAESPETGFLPSVGPLKRLFLPDTVRVDTGAEEGGVVSAFYDPMIAKLIAHADARDQAAEALAEACARVEVWPVRTNAAFLRKVLLQPAFQKGGVDTSFIETHLSELVAPTTPSVPVLQAAAQARLKPAFHRRSDTSDPWRRLTGFRLGALPNAAISLELGDKLFSIELEPEPSTVSAHVIGDAIVVFENGQAHGFKEPRVSGDLTGPASGGGVVSPMPGRVVDVAVGPGDQVVKGQALAIVEAMKMEHSVAAPFDGVVGDVLVKADAKVVEGQTLMIIEVRG